MVMVSLDAITDVACKIGQAANAQKVLLFGSYARQTATETSDVDLLVIADSNLPRFKRSRSLYRLFNPYPFGMDILVYTPEEIKQAAECKQSFIAAVLKEGKVLYGRQ